MPTFWAAVPHASRQRCSGEQSPTWRIRADSRFGLNAQLFTNTPQKNVRGLGVLFFFFFKADSFPKIQTTQDAGRTGRGWRVFSFQTSQFMWTLGWEPPSPWLCVRNSHRHTGSHSCPVRLWEWVGNTVIQSKHFQWGLFGHTASPKVSELTWIDLKYIYPSLSNWRCFITWHFAHSWRGPWLIQPDRWRKKDENLLCKQFSKQADFYLCCFDIFK